MNQDEQRKHRKARIITLSVMLLLITALLIVWFVRSCAPAEEQTVNALYFYNDEDESFLATFNGENKHSDIKVSEVKSDIDSDTLNALLANNDFTFAFGNIPLHEEVLDVLTDHEVTVLNALSYDEILWQYTNIVHLNTQYPHYGATLISEYNDSDKTALIIDGSDIATSILSSSDDTFNFDVMLEVENDATNFSFEINDIINNNIETLLIFVSLAMYENLLTALTHANPTLTIISTDFYLLNNDFELPQETQMYYYTPFVFDVNESLRDNFVKTVATLTYSLMQKLIEKPQRTTFNHEYIHHEINLHDGPITLLKYLY